MGRVAGWVCLVDIDALPRHFGAQPRRTLFPRVTPCSRGALRNGDWTTPCPDTEMCRGSSFELSATCWRSLLGGTAGGAPHATRTSCAQEQVKRWLDHADILALERKRRTIRLVSASLVKQRRRRESVRQGAESTAPRYRPGCLNYASQRPAFGCSGVPHIRSTDWPFATSHASPHARANRARPRVVPRPTKRPSCAARCSGRHCTGTKLDHHPDSWSDAHYADLPAHSRLADLCS